MSTTATGKVREMTFATRLAWALARSCQPITHASTGFKRVACQTSPARRAPTRKATTATGAAHDGASAGAGPVGSAAGRSAPAMPGR